MDLNMNILVWIAVVVVLLTLYIRSTQRPKNTPVVASGRYIPFLGGFLGFGAHPVNFITRLRDKYGGIFSVKMMGQYITFLVDVEGQQFFFKATDDQLSTKDAYQFMVPVFGSGVVYDATASTMTEQVKFARTGLSAMRLQSYVPKMVDECEMFFAGYGSKIGDKGSIEMLDGLADLTILTASKCLLGDGIRSRMGTRITQLYRDFDSAINGLGFFFPNMPMPAFRKRNRARAEICAIFKSEIDKRRQSGEKYEDMLQTLMDAQYKDGSDVPDEHICGIMIAVLFAGQHTSSITATWTGLMLMSHPEYLQRVLAEQKEVLAETDGRLTFEGLKKMEVMHRAVQETLRMYPPLIFLFRRLMVDMKIGDLVLPKGDMVGVAPSVGHRNEEVYAKCNDWDPDRFAPPRNEHLKQSFGWIGFGGGRHGCIGEQFGLLQVKTVWTVLLRDFDWEIDGVPLPDYHSLVVGPKAPIHMRYTRKHFGALAASS